MSSKIKSLAINLNRKQLDTLSEISKDIGLVTLASVVLPAVLDKFNPTLLVLGGITTVTFWAISIWLRK